MKQQKNSKTLRVFRWGRGTFSTHFISYVKGSTVHSSVLPRLANQYSVTGGHRFVMFEKAPPFKVRYELAPEQKKFLKMSVLFIPNAIFCACSKSVYSDSPTCIDI